MQPLEADVELWAATWDHSTQRRIRGDVPYFNRRTGALEFARRDWEPSTGQNSPAEEVILSWPKADREQVSLFADEKAAKAWLHERGFAVKWKHGPA